MREPQKLTDSRLAEIQEDLARMKGTFGYDRRSLVELAERLAGHVAYQAQEIKTITEANFRLGAVVEGYSEAPTWQDAPDGAGWWAFWWGENKDLRLYRFFKRGERLYTITHEMKGNYTGEREVTADWFALNGKWAGPLRIPQPPQPPEEG